MCGADTFYTVKSKNLVFPHLYTYTQLLSKRKDPLKECYILEVAYCTVLGWVTAPVLVGTAVITLARVRG